MNTFSVLYADISLKYISTAKWKNLLLYRKLCEYSWRSAARPLDSFCFYAHCPCMTQKWASGRLRAMRATLRGQWDYSTLYYDCWGLILGRSEQSLGVIWQLQQAPGFLVSWLIAGWSTGAYCAYFAYYVSICIFYILCIELLNMY